MGDRLRLSKTKKMQKKLRKGKEETGKCAVDSGKHKTIYWRLHPPFMPKERDAYEEARLNKAYYDLCRQNVIDGERAEHMCKSLLWLKISSILLCITFCWSVIWKISEL